MRFIPSYKLNVLTEKEFVCTIDSVVKQVNSVKQTGEFTAFDGIKIYYEYFLAQNSKANLVIVHGLSEFTSKFYEFIYYALNQGFNVFIYDQRCHGLSQRLTKFKDLLHVDDFEDYVKDLSFFIDEIVLKVENKPLYLFAHSMGGAIAALYLAKNKNKITKAIFSAPMFEPVVKNVPFKIAQQSVKFGKIIFGKKRKFFINEEFNPNTPFYNIKGLSKARFEFNMKLRIENPNYQTTPMSFGWVSNSLLVGKKILSKKVINNIETPILLLSANKDTMVNNQIQKEFAQKCKNCRFKSITNATHAVLASDEHILLEVLNCTFDFFR